MAGFNFVCSELMTDMTAIQKLLQALRAKIEKNRRKDTNPNGKLTQPAAEYLASIELDQARLVSLLTKDRTHWH